MCFIYLGGLGRIIHTNVALSVYKLPFVLYCMSLGYVGIVAFQFKRLCYLREKDITRDGDVEWDIPHRLHAHNRGIALQFIGSHSHLKISGRLVTEIPG